MLKLNGSPLHLGDDYVQVFIPRVITLSEKVACEVGSALLSRHYMSADEKSGI
jgi:hypothetical protein